jgi:Uma2 family endonuclease
MNAVTALEPAKPPVSPTRDDEALYEIIDGQKVELPPMSIRASRVASRLHGWLNPFCRDHNLGEAVMEALFHLPLPQDRNWRPDLAFVSAQRLAQASAQPEDDNAWDVLPDLAVEVISPTELADDLMEKIEEFFQAGARLVWVIYPRRRLVHVYESLTQIRGLTQNDALDGGAVLPGFQLPLANLFPTSPPPANGNGQ